MSKPPFEDLFRYRSGRRNRKSLLILFAVQAVASISLTLIVSNIVPTLSETGQAIATLIVLAVAIPILVSQFSAMAQRCRDLNANGFFVLLCFIPIVSILFQAYVFCRRGTPGPNKYGPDPLGDSSRADLVPANDTA